MTSSNTEPQRPRYPDTWNSRAGERRCAIGDPCDACLGEKCEKPKPQDCPNSALHGNPYRYCPSCAWMEEAPQPNDALGELTTLILGKTATAAAKAILAAGYVKSTV